MQNMNKKMKVLFLSTGDSTRSQMAEGFLSTLAGDRFSVLSAVIEPGGSNSMAAEVMREVGIDISSQEPASVANALKESFGYVIAIFDSTKERSPIFPFALNLLRWSIADPTAEQGSSWETKAAFRCVRDQIESKVEGFVHETAANQQERNFLAYA